MRPLNRPMFKMGGPVKEGIMDGIREPKANGGTIGGGTIVGEDKGKGRTGFFNPLLASLGTAGLAALRASPRFLKTFGPAAARGFKAAKAYKPASQNLGFLGRAKDLFLPKSGLGAPMAGSRAEGLGFRTGSLLRSNPGSAFLLAGQIKNTPEILEGAYNIGKSTVQGAANYLLGTEFGKEKPDLDVGQRGSTVGQRGKTPDTINQTTEKGNQFNEDGSKKETSVSRLLKAVEKRSRDAAVADSLIAAGDEIRTGGIDSDTVGNITQRVSKEFDKDVELKQKLDLARIESELKKDQIKAQAIATDPIALDRRKRAQLSINEIRAMDRGGTIYGAKGGAKLLAQEFERNTGVLYQGSLGGDDALKDLKKKDDFKLNPESVIKDSIEKVNGGNGTYTLGEELYEYLNGVVKKLK